MSRMTSCTSLSFQVGMPSGRVFPFFFGICTRLTGVHRNRSYLISSMMASIFCNDIPSAVSSVGHPSLYHHDTFVWVRRSTHPFSSLIVTRLAPKRVREPDTFVLV